MLLKDNVDKLIATKWYIIKDKSYNINLYGQVSIVYQEKKLKRYFYILDDFGVIEALLIDNLIHTYPDMTVELVEEMSISLSSRQISKDQILKFKSDINKK